MRGLPLRRLTWAGLLAAVALSACAAQTVAVRDPEKLDRGRWIVVAPELTLVQQQGRTDCGSAALAMVMAHHDSTITPAMVRQQVGAGDTLTGVSAGRLREVAQAHGLDAFLIQGTLEDLEHELRQGRPVLVGVRRVVGNLGFPHFAVVAGIDSVDRQILTADPEAGWTRQSFGEFQERWQPAQNLALVVMPRG